MFKCCPTVVRIICKQIWGALSATATFYSATCIVLYTQNCFSRLNYRTASMQCSVSHPRWSEPYVWLTNLHVNQHLDVNWIVNVINKLRLPPTLLMTPPAHRRAVKTQFLPTPPAFSARLKWSHRSSVDILCIIKLQSMGYHAALFA